jgi:8-oxo-dGTP pyrophosphatase MutT (NUDIX family)
MSLDYCDRILPRNIMISHKTKKIINDNEDDDDDDDKSVDNVSNNISDSSSESEIDNISDSSSESDKDKKKIKSKSKSKSKSRTILYIQDDNSMPVTAGGVLIYKNINNTMHLLMIDNLNIYEDIGGKIDPDDEDIYDAIAREVEEETNKMIEKKDIIERIKKAQQLSHWVYVSRSKYVIFLIEASDEEIKLKKEDFGDRELHDDFPRTINWMPKENLMKPEIMKYKMNWRMKSRALFDKMKAIEANFKFSHTNLFKKQ